MMIKVNLLRFAMAIMSTTLTFTIVVTQGQTQGNSMAFTTTIERQTTSPPITTETPTVRLAGGSNATEGRVEVYYNTTWGTVCHVHWSQVDAMVVCRQLGLPHGNAQPVGGSIFGRGTGQVWLDHVECTGSEDQLSECRHQGWGTYSSHCEDHGEDAGVICTDDTMPVPVRLDGGSNDNEGRVEVYFHDTWGTVCDDYWSAADAKAVCRQLGLPYGNAHPVGGAVFGAGTGIIWLSIVSCGGSESHFGDCLHVRYPWGAPNSGGGCNHNHDAGVICTNDTTPAPVRLVGGSKNTEGRVEIYFNKVWGTVCNYDWDTADAMVVCRQLGMPYGHAQPVGGAVFGEGAGQIWLRSIACRGSESSLTECLNSFFPWGGADSCDHAKDAAVICTDEPVRLVGGSSVNEGRVEVYFSNTWGTVCHVGWDEADAMVICRQLGLPYTNAQPVGGTVFGEGTGRIWLRAVNCGGSESSLDECLHPDYPWGSVEGCDHTDDAAVVCAGGSETTTTEPKVTETEPEVNETPTKPYTNETPSKPYANETKSKPNANETPFKSAANNTLMIVIVVAVVGGVIFLAVIIGIVICVVNWQRSGVSQTNDTGIEMRERILPYLPATGNVDQHPQGSPEATYLTFDGAQTNESQPPPELQHTYFLGNASQQATNQCEMVNHALISHQTNEDTNDYAEIPTELKRDYAAVDHDLNKSDISQKDDTGHEMRESNLSNQPITEQVDQYPPGSAEAALNETENTESQLAPELYNTYFMGNASQQDTNECDTIDYALLSHPTNEDINDYDIPPELEYDYAAVDHD